ncbi:fungal specific transcription factor domain-containing protein [Colletotrichum graminicola M1.001]|uniref:Fungal specific transcription factor domain-containing protein n=1 Tax=Colletotrichum graminicola (strain M1.001 / M2 / FGSC 10212) TaxID=645133 RepID=E3QSE1_COLGM|nr:fungal specific transcription factor domain-containing protein [Colletotrichum graminicola M1.001]EFQ33768.1 fungal specific transcription factor domain-containing protein [Colletotrichum graminicola M1.001]
MADAPTASTDAGLRDDGGPGVPTPASNISHPSPSSLPLPSSERRKRSLPEGSPDDGRSSSAAAVASANRRRSHKVSRACDYCKAKKLKCSGTIPCDVCTRKRLSCIYDASYRRGRPPTPPPATGTPRHSITGATLAPLLSPIEAQRFVVATTREALHGISRLTSHRRPLPTKAPLQLLPPGAAFPGLAMGTAARPSHPESGVVHPDAGGNASFPPTSRASPEVEMAEIEGQYFDNTSSLSFLHRAWKRLSSQRSHGSGVPGHMPSGIEQHQKLTRAGDKPFESQTLDPTTLPDRATGLGMMRFYFDVCVVTYRCLHQGYVSEWFEALLANAQNNRPLHRDIGHAKAAIVMAILAIVTLRQSKVRGVGSEQSSDLRRSDAYFCEALNLTEMEVGLPKLESAQSRILQGLYLLQTTRMNQAWYVFGSILPIVSALGLHRKSGRNRGSGDRDYIVSQCRKRTFWVAYTIDKYLSVVFGRPRMYHDDDIDQDFPDCVNDEEMTTQGRSRDEPEMDCHVESLIFHAKLAQLIDGISREVYAIKHIPKHDRLMAAHEYGQALHRWRKSLPHHLGTVRPMSLIPSFRRQNTALKLAYCHAIMHANRPFLLGMGASQSKQGSALEDSVDECINAAKVALETVDGMASDGTLFHAFWWTPYVTFCALAVVYVWEIQRGRKDGENGLFELADRCQNHLTEATAAESPGRRYSVILEELRQEAKYHSNVPVGRDQRHATEQTDRGGGAQSVQMDDDNNNDNNNNSARHPAPPADMGEVFQQQGFESMTNLLSGWETTDWLDLDSSVHQFLQKI